MTMQEFLEAVAKLDDWQIYWLGDKAMIRRRSVCGADCPITAVAHAQLGRPYSSARYASAARALGLYGRSAHRVAGAADDNGRHPVLRAKLLRATGLAPQESAS